MKWELWKKNKPIRPRKVLGSNNLASYGSVLKKFDIFNCFKRTNIQVVNIIIEKNEGKTIK